MRAVFEGRTPLDGNLGTASDSYKRFAKAGYPGYELEPEGVDRVDRLDIEFAHIVTWHADIRNRTAPGMDLGPISGQEIEVYERRLAKVGVEMEPLDWDLLCKVDGIWLETARNSSSPPPAETTKPR